MIKSLTLITNQILATGIFPDKLKITSTSIFFKWRHYPRWQLINNITFTFMSKVVETIIYTQLDSFFKTQKLLCENQYGFRFEHRTELAAPELIDRIIAHMDKNEIPINIYLDLYKAFDTLDHKILLDELEYYGVKRVALSLIGNYITNRKQYVEIEDEKPEMPNISTGVPQGSILGPLLFIAKASQKFNFIMCADGTTLSSTLDSFSTYEQNGNVELVINTVLSKISEWLKLNNLSLNLSNNMYMLFKTARRKSVTSPLLIID